MRTSTYHISQGLLNIKPNQKKRKVRPKGREIPRNPRKWNSMDIPQNFHTMYITIPTVHINLLYSSMKVHRMHRAVDIFFFIFIYWYISSSSFEKLQLHLLKVAHEVAEHFCKEDMLQWEVGEL